MIEVKASGETATMRGVAEHFVRADATFRWRMVLAGGVAGRGGGLGAFGYWSRGGVRWCRLFEGVVDGPADGDQGDGEERADDAEQL